MPTSQGANLTRARHAAARLIQRFAITCPEDIVLEDIAMALGVLVVEDQLEGAEARLIRKGQRGIMRVKADIPKSGRKRFATAHDLGHWELHADLSQGVLCSEADMLAYSASPPEIEANTFASELLMPTVLFRPRCEKAEPDLELVRALADAFNTTLTATAVRFVEECREPCLVVFSEHGQVRWWRRGNTLPDLWFEPRQSIQRASLAWHCLHGQAVPSPMQRVPTEAWFSTQPRGSTIEVYEQSTQLGRYPTILSLLWIIEGDDEEDEEEDAAWWMR